MTPASDASGPPVVRVLLADDAADLRYLLRLALEGEGGFVVVAEADDGAAAVSSTLEHRPDLVLLDLAMPRMDGLQALREIRRTCPTAVVVVVSGFDEAAVGAEVLRLGARDYLQKGMPVAQLVARVRAAVGLPLQPPVASSPGRRPVEDFVATAAHELQGPVTAIAGFAELLEQSWDRFEEERRREMSARIHRQARHLQRLITGLLTATRAEHGNLDLASSPFSVRDAVLLALEGVEKAEAIEVGFDAEARAVGDLHATAQIVTNLASNALRHGRPPVAVAVVTSGSTVIVRVTDCGDGIPANRRHQVFEKFVRGGESGKGLGLGLYLARQLALAQGGDLRYEDGDGTTFTLTLPVAA